MGVVKGIAKGGSWFLKIVGLLVVLAGIVIFVWIKFFGGPQYPEFKQMEGMKLDLSQLDQAKINLHGVAKLHNPNPVGVTLSRMEFDVYVDDEKTGSASQLASTNIGGNADFEIPLKINIPLNGNDAAKHLFRIKKHIKQSGYVNYKLDGKMYFSILGGEISVPFTYEDKMAAGS